MRKVVSALIIFSTFQLAIAQQPFVLADSTPIRLRLSRNLSSADARVGDTVDFEVLDDVLLNDVLIVKRGASAIATVTEAQSKKRMGKAGKLDIAIDHVRLLSGDKIALRAVKESAGGSNAGKMTGAIIATSIVFFPAAPLFLFIKGKDITIPKGTEITAYVNGDIKLDGAKFGGIPSSTTVVAQQSNAPALTNTDIIKLREAGLSDELIITNINSSLGKYDLTTDQIIQLKKAGVSENVLGAMMKRR